MSSTCWQITQGAPISQESGICCDPLPCAPLQDQNHEKGAVHGMRGGERLPRYIQWRFFQRQCWDPLDFFGGEAQNSAKSTVRSPESSSRWLDWAQRIWRSFVLERIQADCVVGCHHRWLESVFHFRLQPWQRCPHGGSHDKRFGVPRLVSGPEWKFKMWTKTCVTHWFTFIQ